jgi:VIT1/CCC1 family predicted Fe2+/Mn2+ transporter
MAAKFKDDVARWRSNLAAERDAMALYLTLAAVDKDTARAEIWRQLAAIEDRHARRWIDKLQAAGAGVREEWSPGWRPRALGLVARFMGPGAVLPIVTALERGDADMYADQADAQDLLRDEERLGRVVAAIAEGKPAETVARDEALGAPPEAAEGAGVGPSTVTPAPPTGAAPTASAAALGSGRPVAPTAGSERWHRAANGSSGTLRAAVFGVNDGLVSNLSLVMGVAGADPGHQVVLLAGIAGLLAGAFSMAAGEYVSMTSQRELFERQIALERDELEENPDEEQRELALIYQAKGVPRPDAERLARTLMRDKDVALDTLVREELGLDPDELGSPSGAAISSFLSFSIGALIPVLPYLFLAGLSAFAVSAALSAVSLFGVGAGVSLLTGRGVLFSGTRMLLIGAAAAGVTYLVGMLIGVTVAG